MRIEPRDASGRRLTRVEVDERTRPARVRLPEIQHDAYLQWDGALDDASSLRRCVLCSCNELYVRKNFPQVTPFVVVLAFSGTVVALLGYAANRAVFSLLAALLVVDILTLLLAQRQVVCYGCGAVYSHLHIARYHRAWDRSIAERIAKEPVEHPSFLVAPPERAETTR